MAQDKSIYVWMYCFWLHRRLCVANSSWYICALAALVLISIFVTPNAWNITPVLPILFYLTINKAFDGHFADNNQNNNKSRKHKIENLPSLRPKQIQQMSPALRAQFKALQEIYSIKKPNIPLSNRPFITQFNQKESLSREYPQIIQRRKL